MGKAKEPLYYKRQFEKLLTEALRTYSAVYLSGPRKAGKTTFARDVCRGNYVSFNSPFLRKSVLDTPETFFKSLPENELNIVDDAHFAAELFRHAENESENNAVNSGQSPGNRYLLVGPMGLPMLFGHRATRKSRVKELTLLPFSAAERRQTGTNFLRRLLIGKLAPRTFESARLADEIEGATFPELALSPKTDREQWFDGFLSAILQRDIQTVAAIRNPERIVPLLVSLAARVGGLLNDASAIKETGLDAKTYAKYKAAVLNTFLTFEIEPWSGPNRIKKRLLCQSKIYFTDTNLLCYVMRRDLREVLDGDPVTAGRLFENFVATEIIKQAAVINGIQIRHFSLTGGKEADFVIEAENGAAVGIDVSFKSVLSDRDFGNLRAMRTALGKNFNRGFVIYAGTDQIEFSDGFWAVPVNALWE
jgi:predicted AAA+ superfamily ATPase